jgi:hypothetical protein
MARWMLAGAGAVAGLLLLLFLWAPAAASGEEGVFANDCCGTLELKQGRLVLNGKPSVAYDLGRDSAGPYVRPRTYVGAFEDRGFEIDGTRPSLRLRLDRLPAPQHILLFEGSRRYLFKRSPAGARPRA